MNMSLDIIKAVAHYLNAKEQGTDVEITDEQIQEYMKLTSAEKLEWLEEANEFIQAASDDKTREIREKFRKGEI